MANVVLKILTVNTVGLIVGIIVVDLIFGEWISPRSFGFLNISRETIEIDASILYEGQNMSSIGATSMDFGDPMRETQQIYTS